VAEDCWEKELRATAAANRGAAWKGSQPVAADPETVAATEADSRATETKEE
jgi:hypothetical protein